MSHIGDPYEEPSKEMLAAFRWPYEIQVEDEFTSDEWGEVLSSYAPFFTSDGKLEGIVGVDMLAGDVMEYERRLLFVISTASLISSLLIAIVGVLYSRTISRPILHISQELSRVRDLDLERIAPTPTRLIEIARMSDVLMDVKNSLGSFRKYVPSALVTELMQMRKEAALEGERRAMTIFFSDIANFTSISERLTPEELVERLGVYLGEATEIILAEQGTVDKYIGDSVMAFWGAPKELTDHAARACLAALQTSRAVRRLANEWSREDFPEFEVRIGIATGDVVVGNVGYEKRMDYTVLGDNVNLASRLEGLNKYYGTRILISESTWMAARDRIETRLVDHVAVKGKSKGIPVYELLGEKDSLSRERMRLLELHEESMSRYLSRHWETAAAGFEAILGQIPGDQLTTLLLNRCREFALNPPPDDWTGVVVMRNK